MFWPHHSLRRMAFCLELYVQKHSYASVLTTADTWGVSNTHFEADRMLLSFLS
jgi:hypothetical protein